MLSKSTSETDQISGNCLEQFRGHFGPLPGTNLALFGTNFATFGFQWGPLWLPWAPRVPPWAPDWSRWTPQGLDFQTFGLPGAIFGLPRDQFIGPGSPQERPCSPQDQFLVIPGLPMECFLASRRLDFSKLVLISRWIRPLGRAVGPSAC